ncbi:vomeronasal type-1 receptor 4-like [Acomys russatus]|uniref:vomeronasal type-1 receptor 4-like n=1 Tax=Acomys russatus TaxID=60746 RepID=UPI0021E23B4A|nr:vomeronasal type-1 receptor 4-like [Acomys russatus]
MPDASPQGDHILSKHGWVCGEIRGVPALCSFGAVTYRCLEKTIRPCAGAEEALACYVLSRNFWVLMRGAPAVALPGKAGAAKTLGDVYRSQLSRAISARFPQLVLQQTLFTAHKFALTEKWESSGRNMGKFLEGLADEGMKVPVMARAWRILCVYLHNECSTLPSYQDRTSENFVMRIFLFSQITVGMLGNSLILFYYVLLIVNRKHLMPKDLIIEHLTFANCLSLMSRGIPQAMSDYGYKDFLDDIGCKLVMYIYRVTRGMSLYAMCLLSCFQAITISPRNSGWMKLKHRTTKHIGPSCSLGWLAQLLLNMLTPARVSGPRYNKNGTNRMSYGYCSWFASGNLATALYMFLLCFSDGVCLGLMAFSSVCMVTVLYRHNRQVRHIHSAQHFLKVSPEGRATQTVLIMVCMFCVSYSFSSILVIFTTYFKDPVLRGVSVRTFLEMCFPIYCPFVLISHMKSLPSLFLPCFGRRQLSPRNQDQDVQKLLSDPCGDAIVMSLQLSLKSPVFWERTQGDQEPLSEGDSPTTVSAESHFSWLQPPQLCH